jgi:hypothetical protein
MAERKAPAAMTEWKAPAPDARDPAGEREEAIQRADLMESARAWAGSYHVTPKAPEAREADREAGQ